MFYHRTFPIVNLTLDPNSIFHRHVFPLGVTFRVFFFLIIFPFKNKTKISGDSKNFSKINFQNKNKNESCHSSWNASGKMRRPYFAIKISS